MKPRQKQTKDELIKFAQGRKSVVELIRDPITWIVITGDNGIKTCSQPGWPEDVQPQDVTINLSIHESLL